jgi:hypothetical protein
MSLFVKFFSFIIVLGIVGLFFLKKPDGTPWLSVSDFTPDVGSIKRSISDVIPENANGETASESVSVYKWKDSNGNWQFSDTPPENIETEQVLVDTDVNRDLTPDLTESSKVISEFKKKGNAALIKDNSISPTTVSPGDIPTLIDDANNVQELMNNRQEQLDSVLN